jgi:hypothetical protein
MKSKEKEELNLVGRDDIPSYIVFPLYQLHLRQLALG